MIKKLLVCLSLLLPTLSSAAAPSSVALKSSAATVEYGHAVTFTATLSPSAATGQVTFYRGTSILETEPIVGGVATFITSLLPAGGHSYTAYYSGGATYGPSTSAAVSVNVKTVASNGFAGPLAIGSLNLNFGLTVGDFNGDGIPDLAVAGAGAGMSILLGNGDGTFGAPVSYSVDGGFAIAVADFNGDGKADIAIQSLLDITVLLGNGDGTFQPAVLSGASAAYAAYGMAVGDFNHDGKADLAIPYTISGGVNVLLGNGDGTFQPAATYAAGLIFTNSVAVGDFNGDGKADLAVGFGDGVNVLLGNGDGTFQSQLVGETVFNVEFLAVGDFNGDGKADLVISALGSSEVELGNGDGTFQPGVSYPLSGFYPGQATIAVSDVNGDGRLDLVGYSLGASADGIGVALGNGDGTFQEVESFPSAYLNFPPFALADFNGDGRVDMVQAPEYPPLPPAVQLGVSAAPTTTVLASSLNPSQVGENVTFTAGVSPATSAGTVSLYSLGSNSTQTLLGKAAVTGGLATVTLLKLPGGTTYVSAVYSGDTKLLPSESSVVAQQVNLDPDTVVVYSSPNPSALGQNVTLAATVTPEEAMGTVSFSVDGGSVGGGTLVSGKVTISVSGLSEGSHLLQAFYNGSAKYEANDSLPITQVVK